MSSPAASTMMGTGTVEKKNTVSMQTVLITVSFIFLFFILLIVALMNSSNNNNKTNVESVCFKGVFHEQNRMVIRQNNSVSIDTHPLFQNKDSRAKELTDLEIHLAHEIQKDNCHMTKQVVKYTFTSKTDSYLSTDEIDKEYKDDAKITLTNFEQYPLNQDSVVSNRTLEISYQVKGSRRVIVDTSTISEVSRDEEKQVYSLTITDKMWKDVRGKSVFWTFTTKQDILSGVGGITSCTIDDMRDSNKVVFCKKFDSSVHKDSHVITHGFFAQRRYGDTLVIDEIVDTEVCNKINRKIIYRCFTQKADSMDWGESGFTNPDEDKFFINMFLQNEIVSPGKTEHTALGGLEVTQKYREVSKNKKDFVSLDATVQNVSIIFDEEKEMYFAKLQFPDFSSERWFHQDKEYEWEFTVTCTYSFFPNKECNVFSTY